MGTTPRTNAAEKTGSGLSSHDLIRVYRTMFLSRRLDDREMQLKRQQKIFFQISCAGHEAIQVAAGLTLRSGVDWIYPYYRDRALCLTLGVTALEQLLQSVGAQDDPSSAGRQMPSHWGHKGLNIVTTSSPTGTQYLQAVGCADAVVHYQSHPKAAAAAAVKFESDEVVLVSGGDGHTSQGEFYEAVSTACTRRLPVIFLVEDNGYAISVPVEVQTPGGSISALFATYPNLHIETCDGTDPIASYAAMQRAVEHCRARRGPAMVHADVVRPYSHSMSDDERLYRPESEREADAKRDPITNFALYLNREGVLDEKGIETLEKEVDAEVLAATDDALAAELPALDSVTEHVYSEDVDPTSSDFQTDPAEGADDKGKTYVDLVNACLRDEMRRDPRVIIFGEDVADVSREQYLEELKGKGGVFKSTHGLQREFGSDRVFNSPLAEANIAGRAIGMATRGLKPVVEIQFLDYVWPAYHQIRNELALIRWRSGGAFKCPVVMRIPTGGYLGGGAIYHSQSGESLFTHNPGLRVVMPSTAQDANGLLRTAIRCDDPVIFLEPKHLYRQAHNKGAYPGPDYMIPFASANTVREGTDLTVITYGATVIRSVQAARTLEKEDGVSIEVIDLRSLSPYDWDAIASSVRRTHRALVVHEDMLTWGYGAEIAARISEELFDELDAPVRRVAALDVFCAYQPVLEDVTLPQPDDILAACRELLRF